MGEKKIDSERIEFKSNNDFELGKSKKKRICQYKIYNKNSNKGIVVYIPGFGDDLGNYAEVFCQKTAKKYNFATMCVQYFCMSSRPNVGAEIKFEIAEHLGLKKLISEHGGTPCGEINKDLGELNKICKLQNKQVSISASLIPQNGEYQNFGVLPALDILNAIRDAIKQFSLNVDNIILVGSSYGGYIANLVTKFSPGYIRSVFDNSSWAKPNLNYIVGRELQSAEFNAKLSDNIQLRLCVKSPWTIVTGLPNSFEKSRVHIRSFDHNQLNMMAEQGAKESTYYCFYHSGSDSGIAPAHEKIEMAKNMMELGFNVQMEIVEESDVDGAFIKNLSHGLGMSMIKYFDMCFNYIEEHQNNFNSKSQNIVSYIFEDCIYQFDLRKHPIQATIKDI